MCVIPNLEQGVRRPNLVRATLGSMYLLNKQRESVLKTLIVERSGKKGQYNSCVAFYKVLISQNFIFFHLFISINVSKKSYSK